MPVLVAAEHLTALIVTLPGGAARQRAALLAYAIEDRIAQPIETVTVAAAPLLGAGPGQVLAIVADSAALAALGEAGKLPDFLLIRRPVAPAIGTAWAVWREGTRALVRVSDGTGFAVAVDMLPLVWARAGKPVLTSLGAALPASLPAEDLSAAPPDPDGRDLNFRFASPRSGRNTAALRRPLVTAGAVLALGLVAQLGLALADTIALTRIAAATRSEAQALLDPVLPGVTLTEDVAPILARLGPTTDVATPGPFLPLLSEVMDSLGTAGPPVSLRRLAWGQDDLTLILTLQAARLDELQTIQQHLLGAGFAVTSGPANAGDGAAQVDLFITTGAP